MYGFFVLGNVVWLDEVTATRALINMSSMPDQDKLKNQENSEEKTTEKIKKGRCTKDMGHAVKNPHSLKYIFLAWVLHNLSY